MPDDVRTVEVHIPAELANRLGGPGPGLDRRALEALGTAAYQAGELTAFELREILALQLLFLHLLSFQMRALGGSLLGAPPE